MSKDPRLASLKKALRKKDEEYLYDPKEQVEGLKKRFEGSGVDAEKVADERGVIKKALNLPKDQNVLFNFFDLMNRPQQALFNAVQQAQTGGDFAEGLWGGFSGKAEKVKFKDILNEAGITEETEGKLGFDDVAGFAGDILLDPMTWAFLPAKAGAAGAKVAQTVESLRLAKEGLEVAKAAEQTVEGIAAVQEATKLAVEAQKNFDVASKALKAASTRKQTLSNLVTRKMGSGFKGMFNIADSQLSKMLGYFDKRYIDSLTERVSASGVALTTKAKKYTPLLETYNNAKGQLSRAFNVAKNLPENFMLKIRQVTGSKNLSKKFLSKQLHLNEQVRLELIETLVAKTGYNHEEINSMLFDIYARANLFDLNTGNVTLEGQKNITSIGQILGGESTYLHVQGLTLENKNDLEYFIKNFMSDWYDKNITNGTSPLFVVSPKGEVLQDTYHIGNEALGKSLEEEFRKLRDGGPFPATGDLTPEDLATYQEVTRELEEISKMDAGAQYVRKSNPASKKIIEIRQKYDKALIDLKKAWGRVEKAAVTGKGDVVKLKAAANKIEQRLAKLSEQSTKLINDNLSNVDNVKKELVYTINEIGKRNNGKLPVTQEQFLQFARKNFTVDHYMNGAYVSKLEKLVEYEEVSEIVASIWMDEQLVTKTAMEIMGSGFTLHHGYMAHVMTPEWEALQNDRVFQARDHFASIKDFKGDKRAFQTRKYRMSLSEANEAALKYTERLIDSGKVSGKNLERAKKIVEKQIDLFTRDVNTSIIDFSEKLIDSASTAQMYKLVIEDVFLSPERFDVKSGSKGFLIRHKKGDLIPRGYSEVTTAGVEAQLREVVKFLPKEEGKALLKRFGDEFVKKEGKGSVFYLDNNITRYVKRMTKSTERGSILDIANHLNNVFKSNKLLSPGFQLRNIVGSISNMWLAGMSIPDIVKEVYNSNKIIRKMTHGQNSILNQVARGVILEPADQLLYNEWMEFAKHGFASYGNALHDIPEHLLDRNQSSTSFGRKSEIRKASRRRGLQAPSYDAGDVASAPRAALHKLQRFNLEKNQAWDATARFAIWRHAHKNPNNWMSLNGYTNPAEVVRRTLYDYQDLSVFEQDVMKKLIPFYTFTKKNIGFHLNNLMENTPKYINLKKAFDDAWGVLDLSPEEQDRYKLENFWIPIPKLDENGKYIAIKSSLPIGDVGELLDEPIKRGVASVTPLARAPFELAMNKQAFSGMPIQEFRGQQGHYIPELSKGVEYGLSQTGLDVPAMLGFDIGRTVSRLARGEQEGNILGDAFGRSVISKGDPEKTAERKAYNELDHLQNMLRYYKQEGVDIMRLSDINNQTRFTNTNMLIRKIRELRGGR